MHPPTTMILMRLCYTANHAGKKNRPGVVHIAGCPLWAAIVVCARRTTAYEKTVKYAAGAIGLTALRLGLNFKVIEFKEQVLQWLNH